MVVACRSSGNHGSAEKEWESCAHRSLLHNLSRAKQKAAKMAAGKQVELLVEEEAKTQVDIHSCFFEEKKGKGHMKLIIKSSACKIIQHTGK